jgi:hypothetical protein
MHETGLSKEAQAEYDKWDDPQYMAGYDAGTKWSKDERHVLKKDNADLQERIKELNGDLELCVLELNDLKQPWYVKLWNKLPRISINIERGA